MQVRAAIDEFLHFCAVERRLSENTLQAYACDLADFRKGLPIGTLLSEVSTETLKSYLEAMVAQREMAPASVRRRFACLRGFFRRATEQGYAADPFIGWRLRLPRRKRLPRALARGEVSSLLAALGGAGTPAEPEETVLRIAFRLMVATGLRVGELCKLQIDDISPDAASLRILGKGSRDRIAYIADEDLRAGLRQLAQGRRAAEGVPAPLFVNRFGTRLKPPSVRLKLHRLAGDAGLTRRVTPHMLRHTAATLLIETGVDIRIVQRLLGHSSIATTEIYTHVSDEALRATLERANVLGTLLVPQTR
jgi:integrase/recombinase XerD